MQATLRLPAVQAQCFPQRAIKGSADQGRALQAPYGAARAAHVRATHFEYLWEQPSTWASEPYQHASTSPPGAPAAAPEQPPGAEEADLCHVLEPELLHLGQKLAAFTPQPCLMLLQLGSSSCF